MKGRSSDQAATTCWKSCCLFQAAWGEVGPEGSVLPGAMERLPSNVLEEHVGTRGGEGAKGQLGQWEGRMSNGARSHGVLRALSVPG